MGAKMDLSSELLTAVSDVLADTAPEDKKIPVSAVIEYALLPEHLADYADQHGNLASTQKSDTKDVQALRARHHGVARLLAEGVPEGVVAEMTGYTGPYISTLKNTPAMIELIEFYRSPKTETAKLMGEKLRVVADMSLELIQKRLEDKPDDVSVSELTNVAKLGFDRSGNGPNSTVTNINEHRLVADEELKELARSARRKDRDRIVDVEAVRSVLPKEQIDGAEQPRLKFVNDQPDDSGADDTPLA